MKHVLYAFLYMGQAYTKQSQAMNCEINLLFKSRIIIPDTKRRPLS